VADILVNVNWRHDPYSEIKRWALASPYEHVFMYMGWVGLQRSDHVSSYLSSVPMLFESNAQGVVLQNIHKRYGQEVVVMRLKSDHDRERITHVLDEAINLAGTPETVYDYFCIVRFILPRLICEKLGIPMPLAWHRNPLHVCSEAVFEIFYRAKLVDILPSWRVPLPGDFVTDSPLLEKVWRGRLSEELV